MIFFIISIVFLYVLVLGTMMLRAKIKKQETVLNKNTDYPTISVIIPFRNEEKNIISLIDSIEKQSFAKEKLEVLLINDHSEDLGVQLVQQRIEKGLKVSFRLVEMKTRSGKKAAIKKGLDEAKGELIVQTDADCIAGPNWIQSIAELYRNEKPDLILGIVEIKDGSKNFLQNTEFASLMAMTYYSAKNNRPILANGANVSYTKSFYERVSQYRVDDKIASGDDMFLLHAAKKDGKSKIVFNTDRRSVVIIQAIKGLNEFVKQRVRWAQKSKHFKDIDTQLIGILLILVNVSLIVSMVLTGISLLAVPYLIIFFFSKWAIDFIFIWSCRSWLNTKNLLFGSLILSIFYPFYSIGIALLSLLYKPQWKGRKINNLD